MAKLAPVRLQAMVKNAWHTICDVHIHLTSADLISEWNMRIDRLPLIDQYNATLDPFYLLQLSLTPRL